MELLVVFKDPSFGIQHFPTQHPETYGCLGAFNCCPHLLSYSFLPDCRVTEAITLDVDPKVPLIFMCLLKRLTYSLLYSCMALYTAGLKS